MVLVNNKLSRSIDHDTMRHNKEGEVPWFVNDTEGQKHMYIVVIAPEPYICNSALDPTHTQRTYWLSSLWQRPKVAPLPLPSLTHAWSLSSTLHDSQWGSGSGGDRADPSRAPVWLVPLSPLSSSVLTRLIPHSVPVKGPKPWLLVAHANIWKCERWDSEREREEDRQRPRLL